MMDQGVALANARKFQAMMQELQKQVARIEAVADQMEAQQPRRGRPPKIEVVNG